MGILSKIFKSVIGFLIGGFDDDDQKQASGVLVNKQSNIDGIPIIYGRRKVGGVRAFISTGGNKKNEYLYMAIVLSEGEIQQIEQIYVNDVLHTDSKYSGLITVDTTKLGLDGQAYSPILAGADSSWGTLHRLRGIAYLAIRIKYDQDVFGGIPEIKCVVKGRKVYDPRSGSTVYSTNPALCLRDYLTNTRYGKGLAAGLIDDTSFSSAANTLDTTVTQYSGSGTQKLYECNAVIDTEKKLLDNVKILLQGMRGLMPYSNGIYSLIIDKNESSSFNLNPDNITSSISVDSAGKDKKYNQVTVKYINPDANWQADAAIYPDQGSAEEAAFLAEDNGEVLKRTITLNTITSAYSAKDLARIICLASRNNTLLVKITATSEALEIAVGDVVTLNHPSFGWTGASEKEFRVTAMQLQDDGDVELTLQEYTASIYPWVVGDEALASPDTDLPDPFDVAAPTNLVLTSTTFLQDDGTVVPAILATWDAADDAFVDGYEVQWKQQADAEYEGAITSETQFEIPIVRVNIVYDVRVRSINSLGIRSVFISSTSTAAGDVTPPSPPTALTAVGGYKQNVITWIKPTATDFSHVEIQASLAATTSSPSYVGSASTSGASTLDLTSITGLAEGDTVIFFATDDTSGAVLASTGWNALVSNQLNNSIFNSIYYKVMGSTVDASVDTASTVDAITAIAFRGVEYESISSVVEVASGNSITPPAVNVTASNSVVVLLAAIDDDSSTVSIPSTGYTTAAQDGRLGGSNAQLYKTGIAAGTESPSALTWSTTDALIVRALVLKPFGTYVVTGVEDSQSFVHPINGFGVERFYKARSFDRSGNASAYTATVSATTAFVDDDAFTQNVYNLFANANVNQIEIYATLPLLGDYLGQVIFLTADNLLYRWDGSAWIKSVPATDIDGQIITTQISNNSITTDKIVANNITGGLMATAGIITTAAQIDNAVVEAAAIKDAAITTAKIADLSVETLKIQNNAVTLPLGAQNQNFNNTIGSAWTLVCDTQMTWTSAEGRPPFVICLGTLDFVSTGGTTSPVQIELRITVTDSIGTVVLQRGQMSVHGQQYGANMTIASFHSNSFGTSPKTFKLEAQTAGPYKIGNNSIAVFGAKK